jgi:hypothetical protein
VWQRAVFINTSRANALAAERRRKAPSAPAASY